MPVYVIAEEQMAHTCALPLRRAEASQRFLSARVTDGGGSC
jgi:hypothetical protein